ncbi:MAG TPA: EamA family transporter [Longimicrobium sp.]|jgi:drug/metabolite transporter (DMT)-like permease|nr:EamA family transporter [Longimicrobium sp.]
MIAQRVRALGAKRLAAYAATWVIWGSTYLAIRLAVQVVPPFMLAGVRSVLAGAMLVGWALLRGEPRPRRAQVKAALATGALFFLIGHGGLFWAEQRVASGPAALMIATEHFWMLIAGLVVGQVAATRRAWSGVAVGLAGVALLTVGGSARGVVDPVGAAVLLVSAAAWGVGTLYFTGARKPKSQAFAAGIPLLGGGVLLLALSTVTGEPSRFELRQVTPLAVGALLYLVVFGSVVAFTAYSWLVEREGPSRALSFTYVNPLVAVLLGAVFAHEPLTPRIAAAAAAIVAAVVLIIGGTAARPSPATDTPHAETRRRRENHQSSPRPRVPA